MRARVVCGIAALWVGGSTAALADTDAGVWLEAGVSAEVAPNLELGVSQHLRFDDNASRVSAVMPEVGIELELLDMFEIGAGYRYEYERRGKDMEFEGGHRIHVDGEVKGRLGVLRGGYRLRAQDRLGAEGKERLRNRLGLEIAGLEPRPGVTAESFHRLEDGSLVMDKARFTIGIEFEAWERDVQTFYRVDVPWDSMETFLHIVGLEIQLEL